MANTFTTPRTMRSESLCTAQIYALELHAMELESFVKNTIFLSKCVTKGVLRSLDIEKINKKKTSAEKVRMLITRIEKCPRKYQNLVSLLKIYQTEKDKNIASNIEAAKSEKERYIAIEKLSQLVCHQICPILTGKKLKCAEYQNLTNIVVKLTELTGTLEMLQSKVRVENTAHHDSLHQLNQRNQHSQQTINQLQEEITRQGEIIQTLQQEKEEIQEQKHRMESELEILKKWITRIENGEDPRMLHIKRKNLEPFLTGVPKSKSSCCNNLSSQNLSNHTDNDQCHRPTHSYDVMAIIDSQSQNSVQGQNPTVQGHRSVQGQNSKHLSRVKDKKHDLHETEIDDEETNEMSKTEIITTEKRIKEMNQTSSRTRSNGKDQSVTRWQHHTHTENTEILSECTSDTSRCASALSITQNSESTISIGNNKMSEKRNDNVIANRNENVSIQNNRYINCTIVNKCKCNCHHKH